MEQETTSDFWPEGLSGNSDLCSKYWLPRVTGSEEDTMFRPYYAMKVIPKRMIINCASDIHHLQTELRTLRRIDHPFLMKLISAFQTEQKVFLITEYYPGGDMFSLLEQTHKMSERAALFYLAEILLAIEYLHTINIVYRDLKPENVVLDLAGHVRLIDFGLCKESVKPADNKCMTRCGTMIYMAPEVHFSLGHGRAADFWSLGVFAYDIMCCDFPIKNCRYKAAINYPPHLSREAVSLLSGLLDTDQFLRLGALKFSESGSVISGGADEVKGHPFFARILDWDVVLNKGLIPPWKPELSSPMDTAYFNPECADIYPTISFSSKYNISRDQQKHFESFNCINPIFFE